MNFNLFKFFSIKNSGNKKDEDNNILRKIKEAIKNKQKTNPAQENKSYVDQGEIEKTSEEKEEEKQSKKEIDEINATIGEIKEQIAKIRKMRRRRGKSRISKIRKILRAKQKQKRLLLKRQKELFIQMIMERQLRKLLQEKALSSIRKTRLKKKQEKIKKKKEGEKEIKEDAVFKDARLAKERTILNKMQSLLESASKDPILRSQVDNENLAQSGLIMTQAMMLTNSTSLGENQANQNISSNLQPNNVDIALGQSLNLIQNSAKIITEAIIDTGLAVAKTIQNAVQNDHHNSQSQPQNQPAVPNIAVAHSSPPVEEKASPGLNKETCQLAKNIAEALAHNGATTTTPANNLSERNNLDKLGKETREKNWGEISAMAKEANRN